MPNITLSCFSRCKPSLIRKRIVCWFFSYRFLSISDRIVCSKSPRECGGARRAERRAARNNRIECPLNRNARRSRGGALTAMFTRARLYALPYPFSQASPASALLYTVITEFTIFSNPPQQAPAAAPSWARVKRPKKKRKPPAPITWRKPRQQKSAWRNEICYSTENLIGVASRNIWH